MRRKRLRFLHIRRVVACGAVHDGVFTRGGNHLKLFVQVAANRAAVSRYCAVAQAKAVKNLAVCSGHVLVADFGRCLVAVKAVGVFHDELAPAHQAKAGAAFVPEFGLNLVNFFWQLLVAFNVLAHHVSRYFFAGGLHNKVAAVAVLYSQQLRAIGGEAVGLLPKLSRLDDRHRHFNRASFIHLVAHDGFNLANHAQPHRHVAVNASAQLFDHAGARHQLVAGNFSVSRCFFEGGNVKLRGFHGLWWVLRLVLTGGAEFECLALRTSLCIMHSV